MFVLFGRRTKSHLSVWGPAIVNGLSAYYVILCCAWGTCVSPFVSIVQEGGEMPCYASCILYNSGLSLLLVIGHFIWRNLGQVRESIRP